MTELTPDEKKFCNELSMRIAQGYGISIGERDEPAEEGSLLWAIEQAFLRGKQTK